MLTTGLSREERVIAGRIPRTTLEAYLRSGEHPEESAFDLGNTEALHRPMGAFVTLKKAGKLRGCVGHIQPLGSLWEEIRDVSILAATKDTRFPALTANELPDIDLSISNLTPAQYVEDPFAFEIGVHGIIFELGSKRAVFLPQVAPQWGWSPETTFEQLARKAGLPDKAWNDPAARFSLFQGQVFDEQGNEDDSLG